MRLCVHACARACVRACFRASCVRASVGVEIKVATGRVKSIGVGVGVVSRRVGWKRLGSDGIGVGLGLVVVGVGSGV